MSTKELVITTRLPLSGNLIEEAATVTTAGAHAKAFGDALATDFGEGFSMKIESTTKRTPQNANGAAKPLGRPRKPTAATQENAEA